MNKWENKNVAGKVVLAGTLVWAALVALFFAPSVFGDKVLAPMDCLECLIRPYADKPVDEIHNHFVSDGITQYLPYDWAMYKSWTEDGYMGWNPYTHNGCAMPENTMACPGDYRHWLYAVMPFWEAWNLGIISQFFLAGIGMLLLLRYHKVSIWAALLAAVSFAFYSQFVVWIYHRWLSGAMIWTPFLVWALLKYKRYIVNVPAIVFMALMWRGGHLQACCFAFMVVVCMWLVEIWKKDTPGVSWRHIFRVTASFFLTGLLGAVLSMDVFVEVLARMGGCKNMPFVPGINNMPVFLTLLFPNIMGTPGTMDVAKIFSLDLFDIKFGGAVVCILALIACFNARAPRAAKALFIISAVAACTPLLTYIYSRSTIIMGMGMAWLAAWQLNDFTRTEFQSRNWKRISWFLFGVMGVWLLASVMIVVWRDSLESICNQMVIGRDAERSGPEGRIAWQQLRISRFLNQILIWDWQNLLISGAMFLGIFCCSRIKVGGRRNAAWMLGVVVLTFVELFTFSQSWITYAEKPESPYLYKEPSWMGELKKHAQDGSVQVFNTVMDRDFLGKNHLSSYDVRQPDGYETFQPKYLRPLNETAQEPEDFAQAGISHIFADAKWVDVSIPGWNVVMSGKDFKLFENPAYKGRYLLNGTTACKPDWRTCNRIHLTIPSHAESLCVVESYHKGWKACIDGQEIAITPTERGGMYLQLPPSDQTRELLLQFRMPYRMIYYPIMALCALSLLIVAIVQRRRRGQVSNG